jgi:glycosyltransferase involved in cell wall biosynthesis
MPRLTLAILAYRQEDFIEGAARSAFAQTGEPIEILLSDDCSPDGTFTRMQALAAAYEGPHRVVARRNAVNLGIGAHYNEIMRAASGQLLVLMAGDDLSTSDRVARVAQAWDASGQRLDLIASHLYDMGFDGRPLGTVTVDDLSKWPDVAAWARQRPHVVGAAHAVTRRLFERFGPLQPGVSHEDQVNTLRALGAGGACTIDAPLVHYRRGGMSGHITDASATAFIARMRRRNDLHLALHQQWLADARQMGCEALVAGAFAYDHQRELFIRAQLNARDWSQRWQAIHAHAELPWAWRLRRAAYLGAPRLALAAQGAKAGVHRVRKG